MKQTIQELDEEEDDELREELIALPAFRGHGCAAGQCCDGIFEWFKRFGTVDGKGESEGEGEGEGEYIPRDVNSENIRARGEDLHGHLDEMQEDQEGGEDGDLEELVIELFETTKGEIFKAR